MSPRFCDECESCYQHLPIILRCMLNHVLVYSNFLQATAYGGHCLSTLPQLHAATLTALTKPATMGDASNSCRISSQHCINCFLIWLMLDFVQCNINEAILKSPSSTTCLPGRPWTWTWPCVESGHTY